MATLVLQMAGSAVGGMIGGPVGAIIGRAAGALMGNVIDGALLGQSPKTREIEGPRLNDLTIQSSSEGAFVPRVYGRVRLAGQVIWATRFEEEISTTTSKSGAKGGKKKQKTRVTEYHYYANLAIGLCEGPISRVGRVWADGKPVDLSGITMRVYRGTDDQLPDSLIEAKEGAGNSPAYRGLAYVVFDRLPVGPYGNRIPQFSFEVFNALDDLEGDIRGVDIIPGASEFGYHTVQITRDTGTGVTAPENTHSYEGQTDWQVSMDDLTASCPNLNSVALIVSWFGTDLRCGSCQIMPGVEMADKQTSPESWSVAGLARAGAHVVSQSGGAPAYGGTPSDASVVAALKDLKARGLDVMFYPFILMDIAAGNTLPDPWTGAAGQGAYPWRGRITCDPAPGRTGSADKTAAAATQTDAFFGTAAAADFHLSGEQVIYTGPAEWSYRRMILHYAWLCRAAGGVEAFLVGSELKSLTTLRSAAAVFPVVSQLKDLAADVRTILGADTKISYAADWSEYFGHQPQDGSGDVFFHLDDFWADPHVDFIGIDNYMPLADWRDGDQHLDALAGYPSIYDPAYLRSNIAGGEGYDWYYASAADRDAQIRTPISDSAHGEHWVFRPKDIRNWWLNSHHDRPGGIRSATATAWAPQSKPVRFTEIGCPAIDRGANQPNVFVDEKSAESARPYFSTGERDDFIQRRFLQAVHQYWNPASPVYQSGSNPVSAVFGDRMVDVAHMHVWSWDARPFPAFPALADVWADSGNWSTGHWINGRMGAAPIDRLVAKLAEGLGAELDVNGLAGHVDGYVLDRPLSAREGIEPLALAFFFQAVESGGGLRFFHKKDAPLTVEDSRRFVVVKPDDPAWRFIRAQETELPMAVRLGYIDAMTDYRHATVEARRLVGGSARQISAEIPMVMDQALARRIAEIWLQEIWLERERAEFTLPPSRISLDPGDMVSFMADGRNRTFRLTAIKDGAGRAASAVAADNSLYSGVPVIDRHAATKAPEVMGPAMLECLDLPLLTGEETPHAGYFAAFADPWPGAVAIYRSAEGESYRLNTVIEAPATMGESLEDFASGPVGRWDHGTQLSVRLYGGALQSLDRLPLLAGGNIMAIRNEDGDWEIFQFRTAQLTGENTYTLSGLLRGQFGTGFAMRDPVAAGARLVLVDETLVQADMLLEDIGQSYTYRFGPYGRDMADPVYRDKSHSFSGAGLRPWSPVHVHGHRETGSNDIVLDWIRRTRSGGMSWNLAEVPLGEDEERYEVDILDAGNVRRTLNATQPLASYTETMQQADWGTLPSQLQVRIAQVSPVYGRGPAVNASLNF